MEEGIKEKKQTVSTLDYMFGGYIESGKSEIVVAKGVVVSLLLVLPPIAWILILTIAGYDHFIPMYFLAVSMMGFMLGIYMVRNSMVEWIWECGACLMQHLERYENFPWISKAASGGIACFLIFCLIFIVPFAISTATPKKPRENLQFSCMIIGAVAGWFLMAYKLARI